MAREKWAPPFCTNSRNVKAMNQSPAGTVHGRLFRSGERRGPDLRRDGQHFARREQGESERLTNLSEAQRPDGNLDPPFFVQTA